MGNGNGPENSIGIRQESIAYYSDLNNVRRKWIEQYSRISMDGNYQKNKSCIIEVFNMLDIALEIRYRQFVDASTYLGIKTENGKEYVCYEYQGREVYFFDPGDRFKPKLVALRRFGVDIPHDIDDLNKNIRNVTVHGNETIVSDIANLNYENTKELMLKMSDLLVRLGFLEAEYQTPTFDQMRTRIGKELKDSNYRVNYLLSEGGTSYVYLGTQISLSRRVAIKELKPDKFDKKLIDRECNNLKKIRHPNVPRIIDVFYENGTYYIIMEYIEGDTLDKYCQRYKLSYSEKIRLANSICDILAYLHGNERGIIYSDLKAQNIMVDKNGTVFFLDFGISRRWDEQSIIGYSKNYAAPEVLQTGRSDYRSDIYSLGKVMEFIFYGTETEGDFDDDIKSIIDKCTMNNPDDRYDSAKKVKAEVQNIANVAVSNQKKENNQGKDRRAISEGNSNLLIFMGICIVFLLSLVLILLIFLVKKNDKTGYDIVTDQAEEGVEEIEGLSVSSSWKSVEESGERFLIRSVSIDNTSDEDIVGKKLYLKSRIVLSDGSWVDKTFAYNLPDIETGSSLQNKTLSVSYGTLGIGKEKEIEQIKLLSYQFVEQ